MAQRSHSEYSGFFLYAVSRVIEKWADTNKQIFYIACVLTGAINHCLVFLLKASCNEACISLTHHTDGTKCTRMHQRKEQPCRKWALIADVGDTGRAKGAGRKIPMLFEGAWLFSFRQMGGRGTEELLVGEGQNEICFREVAQAAG